MPISTTAGAENNRPDEKRGEKKPAFTLLELLIVILLLSLTALLVVGNFSGKRAEPKTPTLSQIRTLVDSVPAGGTELLCVKECSECYLYGNGGIIRRVPYSFKPIKAYVLNSYNEPRVADFGRLNDQRICLRFRYYPNGSTTRIILKSGSDYYYIPAYFGTVEKYRTLEEASKQWLADENLLRNGENFY